MSENKTRPILRLVEGEGFAQKVVTARRALHEIPEPRWETARTRTYIRGYVDAIIAAIDNSAIKSVKFRKLRGGFVLDIRVDETPTFRMFRADFDGLKILEETQLPFASKNTGCMHACGHDCHTAMLLIAAEMVLRGHVTPSMNLRFVFQDAEENPGSPPDHRSGAQVLVSEGVLEGVSEVYGLHIWAEGESGVFSSRHGAVHCNSDRMLIEISSTGGHVMRPDQGTNAIRVMGRIICQLEGFQNLVLNPFEPVVLEPSAARSGDASSLNIRPSRATLGYAVRNFLDERERKQFEGQLRAEIQNIAAGFNDVSVEVTNIRGHQAGYNTDESVDNVKLLLGQAGYKVEEIEQKFGGEDFWFYRNDQTGIPGSFWYLGANQPGCGGHHTPTFNPDESALKHGVAFWLALATAPTEE